MLKFIYLVLYQLNVDATSVENVAAIFNNSESAKVTTVTALSAGSVNASLGKYKMTSDVVMGASGGSTFVNSEILTTGGFQAMENDLISKVSKLSGKENVSQQFEYVGSLKQSINDSVLVLQTKKNLQLVSATAYEAAATTAFALKKAEKAAFEKCAEPVRQALKACEPVESEVEQVDQAIDKLISARESEVNSTSGYSQSKSARSQLKEAVSTLENKLDEESNNFKNKSEEAMKEQRVSEAADFQQKSESCKSAIEPLKACEDLEKILEEDESHGAIPVIAETLNGFDSHQKNFILNFFISTAEAESMSAMLGMGNVSAGAFGTVSKTLSTKVDQFILTPKKRAMVWGMMAKLSHMAANSTQTMIDQLESNGQKTDKLMETFKSTSNQINWDFLDFFMPQAYAISTQNNILKPLEMKKKVDCLINIGGCKSTQSVLTQLPSFHRLPSNLKKVGVQIAKLNDNLYTTKSLDKKIMKEVKDLALEHEKMKNLHLAEQKNERKIAMENGVRATNYIRQRDQMISLFNNLTLRSLKAKSVTSDFFMKEIGAVAVSIKQFVQKTAETIKKETTSAFSNENRVENKINKSVAGEKNEVKKKYKLGNADINTDKDDSLFEIISNRYQKHIENEKSK